MLTRRDLESYRELTGFNLGQIEKDYMQHIFLLNLYKKIKDEIIFKGGTALQKIYGLNRFSEDLDFTITSNIKLDSILTSVQTSLKLFGCPSTINKTKEDKIGIKYLIKINGPLYDGTDQSYSYIRLDISKREKVMFSNEVNTITPIYKDLPPYTISNMSPVEIMAEKIRAILTRNKARDIYDLWFLVLKKNKVNVQLVNSKLKYYNLKFDSKIFKTAVDKKEKIWIQEMQQLIPIFIDFEEIKKILMTQEFIEK